MPRWEKQRVPKLRRHKATGQGVVTLNGKDTYLGVWPAGQQDPPPDVQSAYDRLIGEWLANGRRSPANLPDRRTRERFPSAPATDAAEAGGVTVAEIVLAYMRHAEAYYRGPDGTPTREADNFKYALRPLVHLYATLPAASLKPSNLKAVRELLVRGYAHREHGKQKPCCRNTTNIRVAKIVRVWRWAVEEELIPEEAWLRLTTVKPLQMGRSEAPDYEPISPVSPETVERTIPYLQPAAAGVVRVMLYSGARPSEAVKIRLSEIDRRGAVWTYRPGQHKTKWRGKSRTILLGSQAQMAIVEHLSIRCPLCGTEGRPPRIGSRDDATCGSCADRTDREGICGPWLRTECQNPDAPIFSPARDREERFADKRRGRKTPVQPSQKNRRKKGAQRKPGACYQRHAFTRAIARAAAKAGVEAWHPNQLRHAHATLVRRLYGLEAAGAALGHSKLSVTELYAEKDEELARRVAREIG